MIQTTTTDINSFDMSQYGATYLHSSGFNFLNIKNSMIGGSMEFMQTMTNYMVDIVKDRIQYLRKFENEYIKNSGISQLKIDGKEIGTDRISVMRALNRLYSDALENKGLMENANHPPLLHLTDKLKYTILTSLKDKKNQDFIDRYHQQISEIVKIFSEYASHPIDAKGSQTYSSAVAQVSAISKTIEQIIHVAAKENGATIEDLKKLDDQTRRNTYLDIFEHAFSSKFDPNLAEDEITGKYARDVMIGYLREGDFVDFENRIDLLLEKAGLIVKGRKRMVAGDVVDTMVFRIDATSDAIEIEDRIIYYGAAIKSYEHVVSGKYINHSFLPTLKKFKGGNGVYEQWMYLLNNAEALSLVNMNFGTTRESIQKLRKNVIAAEVKMSQIFNFVGFLDSFLEYDSGWKFIPQIENQNRIQYTRATKNRINLIKLSEDPKQKMKEYYSIFYVMAKKMYWTSDLLELSLLNNANWLPIKELKEDHKYTDRVFAVKSDVDENFQLDSDKLQFLLSEKNRLLTESDDYPTAYEKLKNIFADILSKDIVHVTRNYFSIDTETFGIKY